jgi:hypothetical protein
MLVHFDATKKTNSYHHVQQSHWPEKKIFRATNYYTHNPILLNIENNGPFLPFAMLLLNSHKPTESFYTFDY